MAKVMGHRPLAKREVETDVLSLALDRIRYAYKRFDRVAVSMSGGKDSTVTLELTVMVARELGRLPVFVEYWDEEIMPPTTRPYIEYLRSRPELDLRWYCAPIEWRNSIERNYWWSWDPDYADRWVYPMPEHAITDPGPGWTRRPFQECAPWVYPEALGTVGIMAGMRANESMNRLRSTSWRIVENWFCQHPAAKWAALCKPIYDWKTPDVWTAMRKFGWVYNEAYDVMTVAGVPAHNQRIAQPFHDEGLVTLTRFRELWPEVWDRICLRIPSANAALRYANSPLFGMNGVMKGESETWMEAIRRELMKWPERDRRTIAQHIRGMIRRHWTKTRKAIPEDGLPEYGVTWRLLLATATRGDLKGRRQEVHIGRRQLARDAEKARMKRGADGKGGGKGTDEGEGRSKGGRGSARPPSTLTKMDHPLDHVEWRDPKTLFANSYNPNRVFGAEFELLKVSILASGWTQPVVIQPSGEIIDGFHRWTLSRTDPDIQAVSGGLVPCVVSKLSKEEQILATVRHNRARGAHGILKMADIVRQLVDLGLDAKGIAARLKMHEAEVERLLTAPSAADAFGKDTYGKGWAPDTQTQK